MLSHNVESLLPKLHCRRWAPPDLLACRGPFQNALHNSLARSGAFGGRTALSRLPVCAAQRRPTQGELAQGSDASSMRRLRSLQFAGRVGCLHQDLQQPVTSTVLVSSRIRAEEGRLVCKYLALRPHGQHHLSSVALLSDDVAAP